MKRNSIGSFFKKDDILFSDNEGNNYHLSSEKISKLRFKSENNSFMTFTNEEGEYHYVPLSYRESFPEECFSNEEDSSSLMEFSEEEESCKSDSSIGSDDIKVQSNQKEIFCNIVLQGSEISFNIAPTNFRPNTKLGRAQGDHITAYVALIRAILTITNESTLPYCIEKIILLYESILGKKYSQPSAEIDIKRDRKAIMSKIKETTELLKGMKTECSILSEEEIKQINSALKISKMVTMANYTNELINKFFKDANISNDTVVYSKGRINKNKNHEGISADKLVAADYLAKKIKTLQYSDSTNINVSEEIEELKKLLAPKKQEEKSYKNYLRTAILDKKTGTEKNDIDELIKKVDNVCNKENLLKVTEELYELANFNSGNQIGNLYDYYRTLHFNLKEAFKPKSGKDEQAISKNEKDYYTENLDKYFPRTRDHQWDINSEIENFPITRNNYSEFIDTLKKHLKIMEFTFPDLFDREGDSIKKSFLKVVLKDLGWSEFTINNNKISVNQIMGDLHEKKKEKSDDMYINYGYNS